MTRLTNRRGIQSQVRRAQSIFRACIESLETRTLLSDGIPDHYRLVDWLRFGGDDEKTSSQVVLESGETYFLRAGGHINSAFGGHVLDAETSDGIDALGLIDFGIKKTAGASEDPHWGAVDSMYDHAYTATILGDGSALSLAPYSAVHSPYGSGSINVDIYACGPTPVPPHAVTGGLANFGSGSTGSQDGTEGISESGVRYGDGTALVSATDLLSDDFGMPFGITRTWSNQAGFAPNLGFGNGWVITQLPYIQQICNGTQIAVVTGGDSVHYFDTDEEFSTFSPRFFDTSTMSHDAIHDTFLFTDSAGDRIEFDGFSATENRQGLFSKFIDPAGNVTAVTAHTETGRISAIERVDASDPDIVEGWQFTYNEDDLVSNVALARSVNGVDFTYVQNADYTYYDGTDDNGTARDLRSVTVNSGEGSSSPIDTYYYRYYTDASTESFAGNLRLVFDPQSYARLAAVNPDIDGTNSAMIADYAQQAFTYDGLGRVASVTLQGGGNSAAIPAGLGTYQYTYPPGTNAFGGTNVWTSKTIETAPDGSVTTVYCNQFTQPMLVVRDIATDDDPQRFATFMKYDESGRLVMLAKPSAITGWSEDYTDLMKYDDGNYYYLDNAHGLIQTYTYADETSETLPGNVEGYLQEVGVQRGETGTYTKTASMDYTSHTDDPTGFAAALIYLPADYTTYSGTGGTGARTQSISYDGWFTVGGDLTNRVEVESILMPGISTSNNGPGTGDRDTTTLVFDVYGRKIWTRDGAGALNHFSYDDANGGGISQAVIDASEDTVHGSPSRDSLLSPADDLTTDYTLDLMGRPTSISTPGGVVTIILYNDPAHETRVYPGFSTNTSTWTTAAPIKVVREYRPTDNDESLYYEVLTLESGQTFSGSAPDGTETVDTSTIKTLDRKISNDAGQILHDDRYFRLTGLVYSRSNAILQTTGGSPVDATASNNSASGQYHQTDYGYDDRGRLYREVAPTGTITRTIFDDLGRPTAVSVGTNDSGSDNMTTIGEYEYDNGGVGDGNITSITLGTDRVTGMYYDWRDRLVAEKQGVGSSDSNRPVLYYTYDNLGEVTAVNQYVGDSISSIVDVAENDGDGDGVPDLPSGSYLRARTVLEYDEQGRVFRSEKVYVQQESEGSPGSTSAGLFSNTFFDHRGNVIESLSRTGRATKMTYDAAGRLSSVYETDGAGDTVPGASGAWNDAALVSSNHVLTQSEMTYDDDSNLTFLITRDRFHDASGTGALADSTGTGTHKARVSYVEYYYDDVNRLVDSVNLGTYGGGTALSAAPDSVAPARAPNKLRTSYSYDTAGRLSSVIDPRDITSTTTYDMLGRATQTIAAWTGGGPTVNTDQTTNYTYDGDDHVLTIEAALPSSAHQVTAYFYGTTMGGGGSDIASNDLLDKIEYPNKITGNASTLSGDNETFKYDALGEITSFHDRNATTHTYSYDDLGRLVSDNAATLGSGVDDAITKLGYTYDQAGLPEKFTSYDSGGDPVNEVERIYNGLGQLVTEYQEHDGSVVTNDSTYVKYHYDSDHGSRLDQMIYPDDRELDYIYATGIDNNISRLSSIKWNGDTLALEDYEYLGLGTVVKFGHPETGFDLNYIATVAGGDGGDVYQGLDRFGRIVDQNYTNGSTSTDHFTYGYDEDGNTLYRSNELKHSFDELYHADSIGATDAYDKLNRLKEFQRGTISNSGSGTMDVVTTGSRNQSWALDALGNWTSGTNISPSTRTHNDQNQITNTNYTYDDNGNATQIGSSTVSYVYDAWNRFVEYHPSSSSSEVHYAYDALGRRITQYKGDESPDATKTVSHLYYSAAWQVILEQGIFHNGAARPGGDGDGGLGGGDEGGGDEGGGEEEEQSYVPMSLSDSGASNRYEYVWSPVYLDAMVLRDKDATVNGSYEERLYVQHDANFNTTAVLSLVSSTWGVKERYIYDPYGSLTVLNGASGYDSNTTGGTLEWSNDSGNVSDVTWKYHWQGLRYDVNDLLYDMRTRVESPNVGRPMQADSAGYADGMNMYQLERSNPTSMLDPMGLSAGGPGTNVAMMGGTDPNAGLGIMINLIRPNFPPATLLPDQIPDIPFLPSSTAPGVDPISSISVNGGALGIASSSSWPVSDPAANDKFDITGSSSSAPASGGADTGNGSGAGGIISGIISGIGNIINGISGLIGGGGSSEFRKHPGLHHATGLDGRQITGGAGPMDNRDTFDKVKDFFGGFGSGYTGGLTGWVGSGVNGLIFGEWDDGLNHDTGQFTAGSWTGTGLMALTGLLDALEMDLCLSSCFLAGTDVLLGDGKTEEHIENIHVGERVATDGGVANSADGKTKAADSNATEVDPKTWRLVTITAGDWQVQSLQPLSEIRADRERAGGSIALSKVVDLQEMGVPDGLVGTVTGISACPGIEGGPGRVVLMTVNHLNDFVYHLTLKDGSGDADTIGVTGYHKIYTEDRGWVSTCDLVNGELVRSAHGDVRVAKLVRDPGAFTVYNMTVETDHVYYVGDLSALVHNICPNAIESHHLLPRQFASFFEDAGLEIEEYQYEMTFAEHRMAGTGIHAGPFATSWNGVWKAWITANEGAGPEAILAQLGRMMTDFGL